MSADALLARLERVRQTRPGCWTARCPGHKDRTPSLSIRELPDGRVLVHDHSGRCDVEEILRAVGLDMQALFPPAAALSGSHARPRERRPFSTREVLDALKFELHVAWVLLSDLAAGKDFAESDRKRAAKARDRCIALIDELRHAA